MKQENYTQGLVIAVVFFSLVVCFSGCTSNQKTNETRTQLSGTWVGNVEMPLFGRNVNASVSKIAFSGNKVEMTLNSEQGTFTANYSYSINGSTLVLEPQFNGRGGFPGRQPNNSTLPGNWTRSPSNETWPTNVTYSYNGTRPGNWTRPENGTWNPRGGQPSMSLSFTYSINEGYTVLYLNGAEFRKI
jgi:hypothetical protein